MIQKSEIIRNNFSRWQEKKKFSPFKVEFYISAKCNFSCKYCYGDPLIDDLNEFGLKDILGVAKQCIDIGVQEFVLSGMEPTLRKKELICLIRYIKKHRRKVLLVTNGSQLTEPDLKKITDCDEICISLDSHIEAVHNFLRNKNSYQKVIRILSLLKYLKKGGKYPAVTIITVINNRNYNRLAEFVDFLKDYDIIMLSTQPLLGQTAYAKRLKLNPTQLRHFQANLNKVQRLLKMHNISSNICELTDQLFFTKATKSFELMQEYTDTKSTFNQIPCYDPWYALGILHNGLVGPCINMASKNGLSLTTHSLKNIWHSFEEIRNGLVNGNYSQTCLSCRVCIGKILETKKVKSSNFSNIRNV
jgi:MoaA/NifB/PqqE/SkfB family radical SAM enzyme